jgi:hypothetical protein
MTWRHRVAKYVANDGETYFGLVEYFEMGELGNGWTEHFKTPEESSLDDLEETLERMLRAVRNAKDGIEAVLDNDKEEK